MPQAIEFWLFQSPFEGLEIHWDNISQSGSCIGSVNVHSLTLCYTPRSMWCDSRILQPCKPFCLGCEPNARVATLHQVSHFVSKVFATNGAFCWWVGEMQLIEATAIMYRAWCWVKGVIVHLLCITFLEDKLLRPTKIMNICSPQFHIMVPKL